MSDRSPRLLVVAPHPDDETLGAGGTMARFALAGGHVTVLTVAAHMPPLYPAGVHEKTLEEARLAHAQLGVKESLFLDNPAVLLSDIPLPEFNGRIHQIVHDVRPDIVLVPFPDRHVDHRKVFEAAMVAARPIGSERSIQLLAAYEVLSETHWNAPHLEPTFAPNWTVDISGQIDTKLAAMACYESQCQPFPNARSLEAVRALALFRGSQVGVGYAEAFHVIRMTAPAEAFLDGADQSSDEG